MTRLDTLVEELDRFSNDPVKKLYEMGKDIYLINNDIEYETEIVFDEILYFFLTDLEYGYEGYLKKLDMNDELELLKDMIAFDCSKNSKIELSQRVQSLKIDVEMDKYNNIISKKLKTYIYSAMSLIDERYIKALITHLIDEEKIDIDFISNLINVRVKGRKKVILKI